MASALINCASLLLLMAAMAAGSCVYNYEREMCCNGRRHHIPFNYMELTCCNQDLITYTAEDYKNQTIVKQCCCNDVVQDMPNHDHWECCGTEVIDTEMHFCYDDKKIDISEDDKAAKKYGRCGPDADNLTPYNYEEEICCDDKLFPRENENTDCCGTSTFDDTNSMCCNSTVVDVEGMIEPYCCGDKAYDYNNSICCNDQHVFPVEDKSVEYCCGDSPYNYKTELCCNETVHPVGNTTYMSCCGGQYYNYMDQLCCEDNLHDNSEGLKSCCGSQSYNYKTHACSSEWKPLEENDGSPNLYGSNNYKYELVPLDGRDPETTFACHGQLADSNTQICCDSGPKDTEGQTVEGCCGDEFIYNYTEQSCCNGKIFDPINQRCYKDDIVNVGADQDVCYYNGEPYNYHTQRCCNSIVEYTQDDQQEGREYCCEEYVPLTDDDQSRPIDD